MKSKKDIYAYAFTLLLGIAVFANSFNFVYTSSKMLPLIVSGAMVIMSLAGLIRAVVKYRAPAAEAAGPREERKGREGRSLVPYLRSSAWMVGLLVGVWLVGFIPSMFVMILAYLKTHQAKWLTSIITAALTTGVIYGLFVFLLDVELFEGILFGARM